jgi:hypothetical protein
VVHSVGVAALRLVLYLDAVASLVGGVLLLAVPRTVLVTLLGQPAPADEAWLRLLGTTAFVLSLLMVLVAQRLEELWWWSWAFVILEFGAAAVTTLHALFGVPRGTASWPWWSMAAVSWGLTFGFLWGLGRAGQERPPS